MINVWRIYDENDQFINEFDTHHDFSKVWAHIVRPGYWYTYGLKWPKVPPPVRGEEKPLKRFT